MLCQECKQRDATVHYTKIINQDKKEFHLCETCARDKDEFMMKDLGGAFSFQNLLSGLLGYEQGNNSFGGGLSETAGAAPATAPLRCSTCGMTYQQFAQLGRFGCPDCYKHFRNRLEPLVRRIHGGATTHTGKVPQRTGSLIKKRKELADLRRTLQQKIQMEQFEEAAVLRDQIRELENQMNSAGGM